MAQGQSLDADRNKDYARTSNCPFTTTNSLYLLLAHHHHQNTVITQSTKPKYQGMHTLKHITQMFK